MRILHICAGWERTNGAAVIAKMLATEQEEAGHEVKLATWASIKELRSADEVWTHCGWLPVLWWASFWARRVVRVPEACYDPIRLTYHAWKKKLVGPIERMCLRKCDRLVATCDAEVEWITRYVGDKCPRVVVTDIKRFFKLKQPKDGDKAPKARHILYLGREHPLKGVKYLREAVRGLDVELREVSGKTGAELEREWEWCDVLCLPTLSDNFGLVIAEALERGKRVITTDGAPAWKPSKTINGIWDSQYDLAYLEGFRDGSAAERVRLLKLPLSNC